VLSALAGVGLSVVASWALAKFVFKLEPTPDAGLLALAFGCAVALAVIGGLALSRGVTRHPPLAVLRGAG
jgi:putative ABC transport system permease protein